MGRSTSTRSGAPTRARSSRSPRRHLGPRRPGDRRHRQGHAGTFDAARQRDWPTPGTTPPSPSPTMGRPGRPDGVEPLHPTCGMPACDGAAEASRPGALPSSRPRWRWTPHARRRVALRRRRAEAALATSRRTGRHRSSSCWTSVSALAEAGRDAGRLRRRRGPGSRRLDLEAVASKRSPGHPAARRPQGAVGPAARSCSIFPKQAAPSLASSPARHR